jgi:hypothetical protein
MHVGFPSRSILTMLALALVVGVGAETPREQVQRLERDLGGLESQVQDSLSSERQLNEALNGAKGRYTAFTNMDWGAVFGGDYPAKLFTEWGELHQDREYAPVQRNIRNVEAKRAAYQSDPSEANRIAVLEAEISYKRTQLAYFQARRLFYEERVDGFMNAMGDIVSGIGTNVAGTVLGKVKGKIQGFILAAYRGEIASLPGYIKDAVVDIAKGVSVDVLKATIREAFIDSFRRRNGNVPRYLAEYWFDNHIINEKPQGWFDKQAEGLSKTALEKTLGALDTHDAQRRMRSAVEAAVKEELMQDREFVTELRRRWGPGKGAELRSFAYSEMNRKTDAALDDVKGGVLKDIPVADLIDVSVFVSASVENAFGNPEVNLSLEATLIRDYKDAIAFLRKYPRVFNAPADEKAFVLEAVREAGQFQQIVNAINNAVAVDPGLTEVPGEGTEEEKTANAIAAWEAARGKVTSAAMVSLHEGIDHRLKELRQRAAIVRRPERLPAPPQSGRWKPEITMLTESPRAPSRRGLPSETEFPWPTICRITTRRPSALSF